MAEKPKKSIQLILDDEEVAAVDRYRRTCENPPSRPAAIRQVLRKMLASRPAPASAGPTAAVAERRVVA
jgi:hypothetical protein